MLTEIIRMFSFQAPWENVSPQGFPTSWEELVWMPCLTPPGSPSELLGGLKLQLLHSPRAIPCPAVEHLNLRLSFIWLLLTERWQTPTSERCRDGDEQAGQRHFGELHSADVWYKTQCIQVTIQNTNRSIIHQTNYIFIIFVWMLSQWSHSSSPVYSFFHFFPHQTWSYFNNWHMKTCSSAAC